MRRPAVLACACAAVLAVPAAATANTISPRLALVARFSTDRPASPAAITFELGYGTGTGQPPGVHGVVIHAPTGTRFAPGRPGACTATDQEATSSQGGACPASSRVGAGTFTAFSGVAAVDPVEGATEIYRTPTGLLELAKAQGSPLVLGTDRFAVDGAFLRASPPSLPGAGPRGTTTFGKLAFTLSDVGLTTTPDTCPPPGEWITQATVTFDDGVSETETAASPCRAVLRAPRLVASPARVRRGRAQVVRLRLMGGSAGCRAGAAVRVGGRHGRTDRRGVARLRVRLTRATRATARAPGCPRSTTRIAVRR